MNIPFISTGDDPGGDWMKLEEVEWVEEVEWEYDLVEIRLVWPGGAEREITYKEKDDYHPHGRSWYEDVKTGETVDIEESPAYRTELSRVEKTETVTRRRTAWVTEPPPGAEPTGKTRLAKEMVE